MLSFYRFVNFFVKFFLLWVFWLFVLQLIMVYSMVIYERCYVKNFNVIVYTRTQIFHIKYIYHITTKQKKGDTKNKQTKR